MRTQLKLLLSLCIFGGLFTGCASGPELDKYPRREIDRPYTLPKGVAAWHIPGGYTNTVSNSAPAASAGLIYPLVWESSLSDDWNLIWFPIPLGVSHQIMNTDKTRLGFSFLSGFGYGSSQGWFFSPTLSVSDRHKISNDIAIEVTPSVAFDITTGGGPVRWAANVSTGPVLQLSDEFALKYSLVLGVANGKDVMSGFQDSSSVPVGVTSFNMGMGMSAVWSFARQWDFRPSYSYSGIGSQNGQQNNTLFADIVYFW